MNVQRRKNGGKGREGAQKRRSMRSRVNLTNKIHYFKAGNAVSLFSRHGLC